MSDPVADRLAMALRAAQLGPWDWDARTDQVTLSERACEILGVEPTLAMTWTAMLDHLDPQDRERARAAVVRAVSERSDYEIEYRAVTPEGRRLWVAATGRAVYADDGTPLGMSGLLQDITARKQVEHELVEERRAHEVIDRIGKLLTAELELDRLLQALTDAATEVCGAQFGAFFYNVLDQAGESYLLYTLSGVSRDAFAGFPMPRNTAVFGPTFAGEGVVRSDDIMADPRYGKSAPYHGMPKGHLPVRSYLAVPVRSKTGRVLGGIFFGHGETGRFTARHERILSGIGAQASIAIDNAELYQQARERAEALARVDRQKDDFLAMLAHELRNPLAAVSSAVELIEMTKPGEPMFDRALAIAKRQVAHQKQLVDDLLDVSRIARGKIALTVEQLDLAQLAQHSADDHRARFRQAELQLEVTSPTEPVLIDGDRVRLGQVIGNLLDNARKFTGKGGEVAIQVAVRGEHAVLTVRDSGIGVEAHVLPTLFQAFTQVERTLARSQGGLGLGLAVVRGIVELHPGGTVVAHSAGLGHGTRFEVTLPLRAAT